MSFASGYLFDCEAGGELLAGLRKIGRAGGSGLGMFEGRLLNIRGQDLFPERNVAVSREKDGFSVPLPSSG